MHRGAVMTAEALSLWLFGALFGLRHALEPDHLVAVSTLVVGRPRPRVAFGLGLAWGLGHTLTLVLVASVLAALRMTLSPTVAAAFELAVGGVLIILGGQSLRQALGRRPPMDPAVSGVRDQAPRRAPFSRRDWTIARRSLVVGVVHGLAGSGALTALIAARFPSFAGRVAYVGLFGAGSTIGMATLSGLAGVPLARASLRPALRRAIGIATGGLAIALGIALGAAQIRIMAP